VLLYLRKRCMLSLKKERKENLVAPKCVIYNPFRMLI